MSDQALRYGKLVIDRFMVWKMAAARCLLKAFLTTGAAYVALIQSGLTSEKLAAMGPAEKAAVAIGLIGVFFGTIDSFLDKTISNISQRLGINSEGNTEILTK